MTTRPGKGGCCSNHAQVEFPLPADGAARHCVIARLKLLYVRVGALRGRWDLLQGPFATPQGSGKNQEVSPCQGNCGRPLCCRPGCLPAPNSDKAAYPTQQAVS